MVNKPVRMGVVGFGKMGLVHASLLSTMPNVQLAAVCERNSLIRKLVKKAIRNVSVVEDVDDFSSLNLDAVYVTTPILSHYDVTKRVYEEKLARHVFVEKPLTSKYCESKELSDLAEHCGGVNMVGYLRRFMVTFMKAKELLSQGVIGEPVAFAVDAFSSDFCGESDNSHASVKRDGVLSDLGSHAIDLSLWFFGCLQIGLARAESLSRLEGEEDSVYFEAYRPSGGLEGKVAVCWCMKGYRTPEVNLAVTGSKGSLEANDDKVSLNLNSGKKAEWYRHDLNDSAEFCLGLPEYYREDAYFVRLIEMNRDSEPSFRAASKVDLLIDAVRQKAEQR